MDRTLSAPDYIDGVTSRDPAVLAKAITLVESSRADHRVLAQEVLRGILPHSGGSHRVGVTGVPGVGKSTFIDQLGVNLTGQGHRVAVLAVDPTSSRTGGSILGDKTRMERLAVDPNSFIRPSPAGQTLGGVARATRETIIICEAAGFDVVLVETVGVGQSEHMVSEMVDFFLVLMLAGAGDELQGIKKGVLELADMIAVNKADTKNVEAAERAAADYRMALHMMTPATDTWTPTVVTCSGLKNTGLDALWSQIELHREKMGATGELEQKRRHQQVGWMWSMLEARLLDDLKGREDLRSLVSTNEELVRRGDTTPTAAVEEIWNSYLTGFGG
jgi:LAO/AO transport system kinase